MKLSSFLWLTRRHVPLWLVLLAGTALSSLVFQIKRDAVEERQRSAFTEAAHEYARRIQWEIDVHVDALHSLRDFKLASREIDRGRFEAFFQGPSRRAFALKSLQWIPVVPAGQRADFESRIMQDGVPDFSIFRFDAEGRRVAASEAETYYPILYVEPFEENAAWVGFDLGSTVSRYRALLEAEEAGGLVVTRMARSMGDAGADLELFLLLPLYQSAEGPSRVSGYVAATMNFGEICRRVFSRGRDGIRIELGQGGVGAPVYVFPAGSSAGGRGASELERPLSIGGREWSLRIAADDDLRDPAAAGESWSILLFGLVLTGFVTLWMRQRQVYVESVETEVEERTGALSRINNDLQNEMARRRKMEIDLRESELLFREAFLHAPIGIALLSPAGEWMQVNQALVKMTGFSEAELDGLTMAEMLHPDEVGPQLAQMGQLLAGEIRTFALEQRFRHKEGGYVWVLMNISQVRDEGGRLLYFVCQILDITRRKKALEEVRRAQQFSENIIRSSIDGILAFDTRGVVTVWNGGMENMTGIGADLAVGKPVAEVLPSLAAVDGNGASLEKVVAGEAVITEERAFAIPTSGRRGFYTARLAPLHDAEGAMIGGVGVIHDVTAEREARERLRESSEKLRQRNRELQDFAYVASHDLQEPLRKIRAFGDRLAKKCEGQLDEQANDYLNRMLDAARRMQTLISDLLAFSRVSTVANPFEPVRLNDVVGEVLSDLETRIEETGAEVTVGELPELDADATQIRQLLQNLIGNGLKYHRPEVPCRIRVYAAEASGEAAVGLPDLGQAGWLIFVEDNGIGFDEKYLDRIFTVFQRLHGRNEYPGTGVGLAICRRIVERHNGWITARSKPGEGTTFIVGLPCAQKNLIEAKL